MRGSYRVRSTRKKKDHPFSAVRNCFFNTVEATAHFWDAVYSIGNLTKGHVEDSLVMLQNICIIVLSTQSGQITQPTHLKELYFYTVRPQENVERQNNNTVGLILSTKKLIIRFLILR